MEIKDNRTQFIKSSFSNYKKKDIIEELITNIYYNKKSEALFYTSEMLCSLYILDLWYIYIAFYCKYIHVNNIKLPIYLEQKFNDFRDISNKINNDFELRNNQSIRTIFFTLTILYCEIDKVNEMTHIHIPFKIEQIHTNLKADNIEYIKPFFKESDPKDIYFMFNELIYHIVVSKRKIEIFYWIDIIIDFDLFYIRNKNQIFIEDRNYIEENEKKSKNIIWLLWEILFHFSKKIDPLLKKTINSLFELFKIKYNYLSNKKFKSILYLVIHLILDKSINIHIKIIEDITIFKHLDIVINKVFSGLKKNEVWIEETKTKKEELYNSIYKI